MIPSNTICVSQEGPANALALNKDCTQVVIAGRNVFKVFSIGEKDFSEVCNLRVGKNLNLNFSSIDVAWSTLEENTLATAATNGAVVVWNLGRSGRSKQEHVFSDHKRTVNKVRVLAGLARSRPALVQQSQLFLEGHYSIVVLRRGNSVQLVSFHLTEASLLISGSQDGMMKCFDLRMKEVARTFISNTESIRDVQFSPHMAHVLAAVSENGTVQLWDARRHDRPLHQFTAHSGPVFACDWHPDVPWLATASRDKTIKVWDIHAKPNLEHTIHTIASVGHVKWRPQKKYQVASCALVLDCAVHVWDVRRPHVPLATFAEHRDVTTAIGWVASPDVFLSTSRDCSLYRHRFAEAAHPVLWANPQGVCVSARGQVAHAVPDRPLPAGLTASRAPLPPHTPFPRKQPTAGSLSAGAQAALEAAFAAGAPSTLRRHDVRPLEDLLLRYRFHGDPPHVLAKHNADLARRYNRFMTAHVWDVVGAVYSARASGGPPPAPPPPRDPPPRPDPAPPAPQLNGAEEEEEEEVEEWENRSHKHSGVLGLPTHTIYIPPHRARSQSETGWVSAASAHFVDVEAAEWTLPEEAFALRPLAPPDEHEQDANETANSSGQLTGTGLGCAPGSPGGSTGSGSQPPAPASPTPHASHAPLRGNMYLNAPHNSEEGEAESESAGGGGESEGRGRADVAPLLASALQLHAALGDVQTAATVLLALQEHRGQVLAHIEEATQEQWLLGYVELLQRHKAWGMAGQVGRGAWLASVWSLSQQSTGVAVCCGRCGRRTRGAGCERCAGRAVGELCAVCRQPVRGLYAWCQGCSHGGHLHHMRRWLQKHDLCPAGCAHRCQLG